MRKLLVAAVVFATAAPAWAGHIQPGLWEGTVTRPNDSAAAAMQNLPPEVRNRLKAQGIDINGSTVRTKICISPAMANLDNVDTNQVEGCKVVSTRYVGNTRISDTECHLPNMTSRSHSEITIESPRHYFGKVTTDSVYAGKPRHTEMKIDARFLVPDCGSVKPIIK